MEDKDLTYDEWIEKQLKGASVDKATCPHCGNDDPKLMAENWHFTHARHQALNYQCHNLPQCDKYFQIGPLTSCPCGWTKEDSIVMEKHGHEWIFISEWAWVKAPKGTIWTYLGNGIWDWREKIS